MPLTRAQILAADDLPTLTLTVPEWRGGDVLIRTLCGEDRDAFELWLSKNRDKGAGKNFRARLLQFCLVDETGQPLFSEADIEALGQKSGAALDRVFDAAREHNRMLAESVKDAEKNSGSGPSAASTSASPSPSA